jgi:His-Xaa-Ser system radical SAM maturase HxsC
MCSQPPKDKDDVDDLLNRNLRLISFIPKSTEYLTISGGEPGLLGDRLFRLLERLRDELPRTHIHILSNGRVFAWKEFAMGLAEVGHPRLSLGIPLYSDVAEDHDFVVQAKGAFDQTLLGLQNLARYGVSVEIRVVLHRKTVQRLTHLSEFIYRNLPFVDHVALMGLEYVGYTPRNHEALWIDPFDYQNVLEQSVRALRLAGMNVSIYNHQLCILPRNLWKYSKQSISDWKNIYIPECERCSELHRCGGLFKWAKNVHSRHIKPFAPSVRLGATAVSST